jgi:heme exporter protein B
MPAEPTRDASPNRAPGILAAALLVARKDLAVELRTRSAFFAAASFTVLAIVIFFFAWDQSAVAPIDLAPGVLWVIFTFSGLLGLNRSFALEQADRALDALLAAPIERESIYLGKALGNLVFVCAIQALAIPAVALFYGLPLGGVWPALVGLAFVAAVGLVSVGTLFSAMATNTRMAELLLPMLALPFFVPVVMPAAQVTAKLLAGRPMAEAWPWLRILLGFDLVFLVACAFVFRYTVEE